MIPQIEAALDYLCALIRGRANYVDDNYEPQNGEVVISRSKLHEFRVALTSILFYQLRYLWFPDYPQLGQNKRRIHLTEPMDMRIVEAAVYCKIPPLALNLHGTNLHIAVDPDIVWGWKGNKEKVSFVVARFQNSKLVIPEIVLLTNDPVDDAIAVTDQNEVTEQTEITDQEVIKTSFFNEGNKPKKSMNIFRRSFKKSKSKLHRTQKMANLNEADGLVTGAAKEPIQSGSNSPFNMATAFNPLKMIRSSFNKLSKKRGA